jgi:hypothetical protein
METKMKITEIFQVLRFNKNHNNKLNCEYFTTIRLNSAKYEKGKTLSVILEDKGVLRSICKAEIVELRLIQYHQLSDWMCYLDGALSADDFKNQLYWFYKDSVKDITQVDYAYMILRKIKPSHLQHSLFQPLM